MKKILGLAFCGLLMVASFAPVRADEYKDALDRFMITELVNRYAFMHDTSNIEGYADLFTGDAVMYDDTMHYTFAAGRASIIKAALSDKAKFNPTATDNGPPHFGKLRHIMSNIVVFLNPDGKTATGYCYVTQITNKPGFGPVVIGEGHYEDHYVKQNGKWLFSRRDLYAVEMANWGLAKELNLANGPLPTAAK